MTVDRAGASVAPAVPATPSEEDPFNVRRVRSASGVLRTFNEAGVLAPADVHVARRLGRLGGEPDEQVLLAAALAVRGVRLGSVCVELARLRHSVSAEGEEPLDVAALPWPEVEPWVAACARSPLVAAARDDVAARPLRLVDGLLYLDRYWRQEQLVRTELDARAAASPPAVDADRLRAAVARLFPGDPPDRQRLAAVVSALRRVTVVAGGPGTGKTTTVARLLALLADQPGPRPRIALAAPTGKAAARLEESVRTELATLAEEDRQRLGDLTASTLHRLLGRRPGSRSRFRHDRDDRLPVDLLVVDEMSMVSLTLMARLLEAVRPDARLVLVGDPDQLASVEAGAVLGDLVARPVPAATPDPPAEARQLLETVAGADAGAAPEPSDGSSLPLRAGVVRLTRTFRFGGTIGLLAQAVGEGDADEAVRLLRSGAEDVQLAPPAPAGDPTASGSAALRDDVVLAGRALVAAARAGDVDEALRLLTVHRVLCAHRRGPFGVARWSEEVERELAASVEGWAAEGEWYPGRPLLVTANDPETSLSNGDTGVVVDGGPRGPLAAFARGGEPVLLPPSRLSAVQTVHAMTVHRGQGSQFARVSLVLPPPESPLLTRELFYTAITRAQVLVRVLGTEEAVRAAVARPVVRASGLRRGT